LLVINCPPAIQYGLDIGEVGKDPLRQDFRLQGTLEAFVLAVALRVQRTAVREANAQTNPPDAQWRQRFSRGASPGGAVVGLDTVGQVVAFKAALQGCLHGLARFIGTGLQDELETGRVIEHGQGMTTPLEQGEMSFEIHRPQQMGASCPKRSQGVAAALRAGKMR
jgi:hypothetical protein